MNGISHRIERVQTPVIPEVADLIEAHPGTISLGQGVVYYAPPPQISDGVKKFVDMAFHQYQAVEGIPELHSLIRSKLSSENNIQNNGNRVVVTAGSNMGFLNSVLAICDSGDEVIIIRPWYFNHEMAIRIAECVPVSVDSDDNFQPDLKALELAITPRTRAIVTVSPNNPTGAVYSGKILKEINFLCTQHGIYHISDEAYEYFCYGDSQHYSPASADAASKHTISLFSTSKSFGLAAWRIGYMLIPEHLFMAVRKIQDTNLICPPVVSQYAAIECLKLGRYYCDTRIREIAVVREHFRKELMSIPNIEHGALDGAFYGFLRLPVIGMKDMEIVKQLVIRFGVAVIPGVAFGVENRICVRVSYGALEPTTVVEGINRLMAGLKELVGS